MNRAQVPGVSALVYNVVAIPDAIWYHSRMEKPRNMSYAVIGTGGIGGYYGSRLEMLEAELRFLEQQQHQ